MSTPFCGFCSLDSREWVVHQGVLPRERVGDIKGGCFVEGKILLSSYHEFPAPCLFQYDLSTRALTELPTPPMHYVTDLEFPIVMGGKVHFISGPRHHVYTLKGGDGEGGEERWETREHRFNTYRKESHALLGGYVYGHVLFPPSLNEMLVWDTVDGTWEEQKIHAEDLDIYCTKAIHLVGVGDRDALVIVEQGGRADTSIHLVTVEVDAF
ncbi:hypothetical protein KIPB_002201 [Kipferlia bialata]|uniref:Uncharacterized protein n=1 Tax=Kipferlia bialata TaxID=797122 RepID=A0A9K3GFT0_9EUKA|nr:hypothetical protein KIPB_002201 [Kipferlia bialata]|eukprot:g2201.t1